MGEQFKVENTNIDGLKIRRKSVFRDERGAVLHMLRKGSEDLSHGFGEVYFSKVKCGVIKGWKKHLEIEQRLVVPMGAVKFVFVDDRPESSSLGKQYEVELSEENYQMLLVPSKILYSFKGIARGESLVANCASQPFRSGECLAYDIYHQNISYRWGVHSE